MFDKKRPEQPELDPILDPGLILPEPVYYDDIESDEEENLVWYQDGDDYVIKPHSRASFLFHPSFLDSYFDLKEINPKYAEIYIESLMRFGVDRHDEVPDIPIVKMALRAPFITISKAFTNYVIRRHEDAREEKRQLEAKQTAKHIKEAINLMETKQIEWEKRIKKEWPYLYGKQW